jgi:hypothetical protein
MQTLIVRFTIQEITVTAQRRTENIQDVPITIQALTAETLQELSVRLSTIMFVICRTSRWPRTVPARATSTCAA